MPTHEVRDGLALKIRRRSLREWILDSSIYYSFDATGYQRHAARGDGGIGESTSVDQSHVLVTGANSGIGFALCDQLMQRRVQVTLLCRSEERGKIAQSKLRNAWPSAPKPQLLIADITDLTQLDRAGTLLGELIARGDLPKLSCLVHNAGLLPLSQQFTSTGHELTVGAHLIGPARLNAALIPLMAKHSRIIYMSSGGMYFAPLSVKEMTRYSEETQSTYNGVNAYALTKRAQVEYAKILHDRLAIKDALIDVQAIHPGWADTPGVESSLKGFHKRMEGRLRTPEQGAAPTTWLCLQPPLKRSYFWFDWSPRSPYLMGKRPSRSAVDDLWNMVLEGAQLSTDWI